MNGNDPLPVVGASAELKRGPFMPGNAQANTVITGFVPFVLPQVMFTGGLTQQRMGQGLAAQVAFTSANTDYTIVHNLGHPVQMVWAVSAPAGVFIPKIKISTTGSANTTKQLILQSDTIANPTTVVMF